MLKQFENTYECAGICYKPLFYTTKNISEGPVPQSCDEAIVDDFSGNIVGAIISGITGLVVLAAGIGAIPLMTGFDK